MAHKITGRAAEVKKLAEFPREEGADSLVRVNKLPEFTYFLMATIRAASVPDV